MLRNICEAITTVKIKKIFIKRAFLDNLAALVFLFKGEKENFRAVISARKEFKKMKDKFKEKHSPSLKSVSQKLIQRYRKIYLIKTKRRLTDIEPPFLFF